MKKIAIIGAGLSGLILANKLKKYADITVFEKSYRAGGRITTRSVEPYCFDHGVQFFKSSSEAFLSFISPLKELGIIKYWNARFAQLSEGQIIHEVTWNEADPHYVGAPSMSSIGQYLSQGLNVEYQTSVCTIQKSRECWNLTDGKGCSLGQFDWLISTLPAEQAAILLPSNITFFHSLNNTNMQGCYSLMLGCEQSLPLPFDAALVNDSDIHWISANNSKPNRSSACSLVIQTTNDWADAHLNDNKTDIINSLIAKTSQILNIDLSCMPHFDLHRWRYATGKAKTGAQFFIDQDQKVAACGDWCIDGQVESAFQSATALSEQLLASVV